MKVEIEKVKKLKQFEPFKCILTFENEDQVRDLLNEFVAIHDEYSEGDIPELSQIEGVIFVEMRKQDFQC